jgi:hypothetical protein
VDPRATDRVVLIAHTNITSTMIMSHVVNSVELHLMDQVVVIVHQIITVMEPVEINANGVVQLVPVLVARIHRIKFMRSSLWLSSYITTNHRVVTII